MKQGLRLLAAAVLSLASSAFAQSFPARPITLICPWPRLAGEVMHAA